LPSVCGGVCVLDKTITSLFQPGLLIAELCFCTELRAEIERLRASGLSESDDVTAACMEEITSLRDRLREKEREMEEVTRSWQERLRQSEERKQEEARLLEVGGGTLAYAGKYFTLWKAFFSYLLVFVCLVVQLLSEDERWNSLEGLIFLQLTSVGKIK